VRFFLSKGFDWLHFAVKFSFPRSFFNLKFSLNYKPEKREMRDTNSFSKFKLNLHLKIRRRNFPHMFKIISDKNLVNTRIFFRVRFICRIAKKIWEPIKMTTFKFWDHLIFHDFRKLKKKWFVIQMTSMTEIKIEILISWKLK